MGNNIELAGGGQGRVRAMTKRVLVRVHSNGRMGAPTQENSRTLGSMGRVHIYGLMVRNMWGNGS